MIPFKLLGSEKLKEKKAKEGITNYKIDGIFPPSFFLLMIGKPGTGKTTLIEEMLLNDNIFNSKFDHIVVFSPNTFPNLNSDLDFFIITNFMDKLQPQH